MHEIVDARVLCYAHIHALVLRPRILRSGISGCLWPIERKLKQNLIANTLQPMPMLMLPMGELGEWLLLQSDIAKFQLPDAIVTVIVIVCVCVAV